MTTAAGFGSPAGMMESTGRVHALPEPDDPHLAVQLHQAAVRGARDVEPDAVGAAVDRRDRAREGRAHTWPQGNCGSGQSAGIALPRSPAAAASATASSPRRTTPGPSARA